MKWITIFFVFIISFNTQILFANDGFDLWLNDFKKRAVKNGISKNTVNDALEGAKFLPNVIKYDRYQPEFYEDTNTYIKKRANKDRLKKGLSLYKKEKKIINSIEESFLVEKELLLALMGIETNFGKHLGKMDIISSLATLSYDKRRSAFFTKELLVLLKLLDKKIIDKNTLYGSWAGAFGNFQFMPTTIKNYALDYNKNSDIDFTFNNKTFVTLNKLKNKDITFYIENYNVLDKAGSYGIQDLFAIHIKEIKGCYYNVMGLPLSSFYYYFNSIQKNLK